jgi:hypothetical protein
MHVEADLLDGAGEAGASECQVLEGPNEVLEVSRIGNRRSGLTETLACVSTGVETGLQSTMPPDVVRRLPENDGGARDPSWRIPA